MPAVWSLARLPGGAGFVENVSVIEAAGGKLTSLSKTLFDRGWRRMPKQRYVRFYGGKAGFQFREAHITYEEAGQAAEMLDIFFEIGTGMPSGYRRLKAELPAAAGGGPSFDFLRPAGRGEPTRLRHHFEAEKPGGGKPHANARGAVETLTLCDRADGRSPVCEMRVDHGYGRAGKPPYSLRVLKRDPLSGGRFAELRFKFEEADPALEMLREARPGFAWAVADGSVRLSSLALYNRQTGEKEAELRPGRL